MIITFTFMRNVVANQKKKANTIAKNYIIMQTVFRQEGAGSRTR